MLGEIVSCEIFVASLGLKLALITNGLVSHNYAHPLRSVLDNAFRA